jgi:hypothetical protein
MFLKNLILYSPLVLGCCVFAADNKHNTIESCSSLLPADGQYELKITANISRGKVETFNGKIEISDGKMKESDPKEKNEVSKKLKPYIECVKALVKNS